MLGGAGHLGFRLILPRVWSERCHPSGKLRIGTRRDKIPGEHCTLGMDRSLKFRLGPPIFHVLAERCQGDFPC